MSKKNEVLVTTAEKIAKLVNMTPEQVAIVKANVAQGTTNNELGYFLSVCQSTGLNPLKKEIWCYKDHRGNLVIFAGRDGFLTKAQAHPNYAGLRSSEVCQNDEIEIDIPNGTVKHKISPKKDRGKIIGGYAIAFTKSGEPTVEYADFNTYNRGINAWKTHPAAMIKKVPEAAALKKAFGITGIESEYEYNEKDGVVEPLTHDTEAIVVDDIEVLKGQVIALNPPPDILEMLKEKEAAGELTEALLVNTLKELNK